jgi:hypothetical protein
MPEESSQEYDVECKPYTVLDTRSEFSRSRTMIECPYCGEEVWGYNWSLAGSGKKCPGCGAIHTFLFGTIKRK